jgi:hypothetical protein
MKKLSFWKKLSIYRTYRKIVLKNKNEFESTYGLRIDRANRIYTVINIPAEMFEEPYNLRTADINKISEPYITAYIKQISGLLDSKELGELYRLYDIQKIDKYSYLVIIGFSLFDTAKLSRNIFLRFIPTIFILSILTFLILKLL